MKKENIHLDDLWRIFIGAVPLEFYVELFIRSVIVYLMIAFGMKMFGKRILTNMSRTELAAISSLAGATGLIILAPDRGILPALIALVVMIIIKYILDARNYKNERFEQLTEGHYDILVIDGVLQTKDMEETRISREQLFAQLRAAGLIHLGKVKRCYIEANGTFSIVQSTENRPGLPIIPGWDEEFIKELKRNNELIICSRCGYEKPDPSDPICRNCKAVNETEHPVHETEDPAHRDEPGSR